MFCHIDNKLYVALLQGVLSHTVIAPQIHTRYYLNQLIHIILVSLVAHTKLAVRHAKKLFQVRAISRGAALRQRHF